VSNWEVLYDCDASKNIVGLYSQHSEIKGTAFVLWFFPEEKRIFQKHWQSINYYRASQILTREKCSAYKWAEYLAYIQEVLDGNISI
jgi:hypothetical protein